MLQYNLHERENTGVKQSSVGVCVKQTNRHDWQFDAVSVDVKNIQTPRQSIIQSNQLSQYWPKTSTEYICFGGLH